MIPASGGERQGTGDGAALPTSSQRGGHINPQAHLSLVLPSLSLLTRGWSRVFNAFALKVLTC